MSSAINTRYNSLLQTMLLFYRRAWDKIAGFVNEVIITGTVRTGKDAKNKWQQLKCKSKENLKLLKS